MADILVELFLPYVIIPPFLLPVYSDWKNYRILPSMIIQQSEHTFDDYGLSLLSLIVFDMNTGFSWNS